MPCTTLQVSRVTVAYHQPFLSYVLFWWRRQELNPSAKRYQHRALPARYAPTMAGEKQESCQGETCLPFRSIHTLSRDEFPRQPDELYHFCSKWEKEFSTGAGSGTRQSGDLEPSTEPWIVGAVGKCPAPVARASWHLGHSPRRNPPLRRPSPGQILSREPVVAGATP